MALVSSPGHQSRLLLEPKGQISLLALQASSQASSFAYASLWVVEVGW
jgi:hypothetical protein